MTRVCCTFVTRPKKKKAEDQRQKKMRVGCLRLVCSTGGVVVVVMGKSMVGLEGKFKGNRMLLRVFVVYGDRGYTYELMVKRLGNLVLRQ